METSCAKFILAPAQESEKHILRKSFLFNGLAGFAHLLALGGAWLRVAPDLCKSVFSKSGFDLLLAVKDRVNLPVLLRSRVIPVESFIYGAEDDMKWNASSLPALHKCPVESGDQHVLAAAAHEFFLDLGKVVEVVQALGGRGAIFDAVQG